MKKNILLGILMTSVLIPASANLPIKQTKAVSENNETAKIQLQQKIKQKLEDKEKQLNPQEKQNPVEDNPNIKNEQPSTESKLKANEQQEKTTSSIPEPIPVVKIEKTDIYTNDIGIWNKTTIEQLEKNGEEKLREVYEKFLEQKN